MFTDQLLYPDKHAFAGFLAQTKFCGKLADAIQKTYWVKMTVVKSNDKSTVKNPIHVIQLTGDDRDDLLQAKTAIESLTKSIETKILDDQAGNDLLFDHGRLPYSTRYNLSLQ